MTKKELLRYRNLCREIKELEERIIQIESTSIGSARITGMPKAKSTTSPIEKITILTDELERIILKRKEEALKAQIEIEKYISSILDIETRRILTKKYIELKSWRIIAREMSMSERTAQRIHKKFLEGTN